MRVSAIAICYASVKSKKGPACPAGLICYGGEQYKPEECGVDGDNNGWCKGASVPPELFMQPEPKKKPAPKASAQKKKKKKSSGNSGKIVARVQAGSKPKPSKLNITRPKKAEEPKPEPTPEPVKKSGGTWLYIFILALTGPLAYLGWKKYNEEQSQKAAELGEKSEAAREEKEKEAKAQEKI
ncbi:unnamed protein product [Oikopleura dioica]|uniref:Uncharacterized protein n=1 Tax=Oikopleura dioica TaxID=34765 RepID=E4XD64_OIKDI|nr:unnamed protein product [Oikopleura dioica]